MFISHKSNVLLQYHESEWQCRRLSKGMSKPEYWAWLESITKDNKVTYPSEDFTIIEIQDENVSERLSQLEDYISLNPEGTTYNIKVYASKKNGSHFVGDDIARDQRLLDEEWILIRRKRDKLLSACDWTQAADSPLSSSKKTEWAAYRTTLRNLPADQKSKTKFSDIEWATKP